MTFTIRQISRTSDGREIIRPSTYQGESITVGRDASSEIHLADLSIELNHASITKLSSGRLNIVANNGRDFTIDGRSVQSVEIDPTRGSELRFGSFRLTVSAEDSAIVIAVERFDGASDSDDVGRFTLQGKVTSRRTQAYAFIAFVLALFLAWPIYTYATTANVKNRTAGFHADELWNSGPLSEAHKKLANDCQACHTDKFVAVTDATCRNCHKNDAHDHAPLNRILQSKVPADFGGKVIGFFKTTFNAPEGRCVDCHTEHEGEPRMAATKQAFCTDCHSDMKARLTDTKLVNASDFGIDHPQFQVAVTAGIKDDSRLYRRVSLDSKPTENNGLIFPHGIHLLKNNGVARMAQTMRGEQGWGANLVCKDCHTPSKDGSRFQPVEMEKDCQMCHSLGFDGRDLKHGEPGQVVAQIRSFYSSASLARPASLNDYARRRPGEYAAVETATDYAVGNRIWQGQSAQAVRAVFSKGGACYDCHIITPVASKGAPVSIQKIFQPDRYMKKGWFDHEAHEDETCASCHNAQASNRATDLLLPGISTCRNCHVGEGGEKLKPVKDPEPSSCALCHDYHLDNKAPWRSKLKQNRLERQSRERNTIASLN